MRTRWLVAGSLAAILVVGGCSRGRDTIEQVHGAVTVSPDGRTITAAVMTDDCRPAPALIATATRRRVAFEVSISPAYSGFCDDVGRLLLAQTHLASPIGSRTLVEAKTGKRISSFDERQLAAVTDIPSGLHLVGDGPPDLGVPRGSLGDTRTFGGSSATNAGLTITQLVAAASPPLNAPSPGNGDIVTATVVNGQPASLWSYPDLLSGGVGVSAVAWVQEGYRFEIVSSAGTGTAPDDQRQPALNYDALLEVAASVQPPGLS